ncbi:PREDICTED: uncharacterized protein LOC108370237 isoform X1 [Rhagoletis zephyria]|uniref:uncharacterized protein LOC108370237 isoform X1 n=1 Tax=Rhagoletis zephyria TaxID=28612 RepID=UPI00081184A5|nr:PREDICTED: uncharacterized protein LOC108370237 isoform X1 [Rhagoletis zephyria]XP_036337391.1 uncharacterized protein LOC118747450 isoform X1 [Rhagoletis pomonella]XP_036337394.1 uncharacterized protein LOC118747452 isoform X1 [Rhagoletis pomonella]
MQKLVRQNLIFACLLGTVAWAAEIYYTPASSAAAAYYAPLPIAVPAARSAAILPLAYSRYQAAVPLPAVETYNSVQTPDSFQQQYRSDYKPVTYEFIH